jgi:cation transport protein ChaC
MESLALPKSRNLSLTAELVARVHREIADPGLPTDMPLLLDADYDVLADNLLAQHGPAEDLHIFAVGSLIWKPACAVENPSRARLRGWRRTFCLHLTRFRGTVEFPGLMMALDRGGSCVGVLQRIPAQQARDGLGALLRREMLIRPPGNWPRWVTVEAADGRHRAIAFTANRECAYYRPERSITETADVLARAVGHWGSGADYLLQTVSHLEQLGIRDSYLWRLQHMVAERIAAAG